MKLKCQLKISHVIVNVNSIAQRAVQIKKGIMKHANGSVKIIVHGKKIIARILAYIFVKMAITLKVLMTTH